MTTTIDSARDALSEAVEDPATSIESLRAAAASLLVALNAKEVPAGWTIGVRDGNATGTTHVSYHEAATVEEAIEQNIDSIAKHSVPQCTPEDILNRRADEMTAADPALKNLIREYHDGLLLYEISNRTVWDKAAKDEKGLAAYFKKNRKRYKWEQPRFKGIAYWVKQEGDVEAVKKSLKNIPFEKWAERLRKEFNDSTIRIKVVKGIFREGDNALIDKVVFAKDTTVADVKDFPISATYGEKLKAPKTYNDVRELVVADYQEQLEKAWIEALRKRYTVVVNKDVLSTVNKH